MEQVQVQRPYRHFKGNFYYVHAITRHSETMAQQVVYQALYPPYVMYSRPLEMFLEPIDIHKVDNVTGQAQRFVLWDGKL